MLSIPVPQKRGISFNLIFSSFLSFISKNSTNIIAEKDTLNATICIELNPILWRVFTNIEIIPHKAPAITINKALIFILISFLYKIPYILYHKKLEKSNYRHGGLIHSKKALGKSPKALRLVYNYYFIDS